jgi:serine/threonine protein kinase
VLKLASKEDPVQLKSIVKERALLHEVGEHPGIIPVLGSFQTGARCFLVLPFCDRGDLRAVMQTRPHGKLTESEARWLFVRLMLALEHIHSKGVIHRDIKPENILLDDHRGPMLTDFGIGAHVCPRSYSSSGSGHYIAPEVLHRSWGHGVEVDVYSLGMTLLDALAGSSTRKHYGAICRAAYRLARLEAPDSPKHPQDRWLEEFAKHSLSCQMPQGQLDDVDMSPPARDLIKRMTICNPKYRAKLADVWSHPWMIGPHSPIHAPPCDIHKEVTSRPLSRTETDVLADVTHVRGFTSGAVALRAPSTIERTEVFGSLHRIRASDSESLKKLSLGEEALDVHAPAWGH